MKNFTPRQRYHGLHILFPLLLVIFSASALSAQFYAEPAFSNATAFDHEAGPGVIPGNYPHNPQQKPGSLFDIEFVYNVEDTTGTGGWAGVCFTGTEFWVSLWDSDSLARLNADGSLIEYFVVPNLANTRGMTFDGTYVYAGNTSNTIYEIDPATRTLTGNNIASPEAVRHITYDSTADGGNGGFYVGNWATDIYLVSRTGATLSQIGSATHGLTSMYGSAFDNHTAGGPYLWVFDQSLSNGESDIIRLQLPSGVPTSIIQDVMSDVGAGQNSGLAGGLFITDQLVSGEFTMIGILQGSPDNLLFGYELNEPRLIDAMLRNAQPQQGYSQIPIDHLTPVNFAGSVRNNGSMTLNVVNFHVEVFDGGTSLYTGSGSKSSMAPFTNETIIAGPFIPPGKGTYLVRAWTELTGGQTDSFPINDTTEFYFQVTDSTYARDDDIQDGGSGYIASNQTWAYVGAIWELNIADTLSSVWIRIASPVDLDTTYAFVADVSNGAPLNIVKTGKLQIIDGTINDYLLEFPGGVPLTPGKWCIGVYEGAANGIFLAQSNNFWTADANWFFITAQGWVSSSILTARFIRPNFGNAFGVGIADTQVLENGVQVFPNPNSGTFSLDVYLAREMDLELEVRDMLGRVVLEKPLGRTQVLRHSLDLRENGNGMYLLTVKSATGSVTKKVVVGR